MSLLSDITSLPKAPQVQPEIEPDEIVRTSLLKELSVSNAPRNVQTALKKSDASDAGSSDVVDKAKAGDDVSFSLMRNTINADGKVSGSDVADYIERAEELNDEVDTIPFGLETDDGQIVKVYVNAEQADSFEEAMKKMLGMEDDIEEAINRLTTEFDIVDVVWPTSDDDEDAEADPDADLSIDDTSMLSDPEDENDFADDNYDVVAKVDDDETKQEKDSEDEIAAAGKADDDEDEPEEDENPDDEEEELDADGNPIKKKKKKKKAAPAEPVEDEDEVKESLLENQSPWAMLNRWAKDQGEFGFATMDEDEMKKAINIYRADKLAEKEHGEFGFATLDEPAMRELINAHPDLVKSSILRAVREDKETDSPSVAAAIKLMAAKGLHIQAMVEGPGNTVYIETEDGDEYVMRGDKSLSKEKHGKKLTSYKKSKASIEENEQEKSMTFGSKFLERVLAEAASKEDKDGVRDGFNIPLDSQARALAAKLKLPFAKRLIAFHSMAGVPGRYLNTEDVESSIAGAADMLRKKVAIRRAFLSFYDALATAKGYAPPKEEDVKEGLDEAKVSDAKRLAAQDPEKLMKAKDAVKRAKKALADHKKHYDGGTGSREKQLQAEIDKAMGKLNKLREEVELNEAESRQKRGSFIQKLFESVLVELGLPESMITTSGPSAVGTGIYRTAELIEQNSDMERLLRLLATRLGIKPSDAQKPVDESLNEEVKPGKYVAKKNFSAAHDKGPNAGVDRGASITVKRVSDDTVYFKVSGDDYNYQCSSATFAKATKISEADTHWKHLSGLIEAKKEDSSIPVEQLNAKANGADEVTYKGKTYRRSGPKNSTSQPGKWKLVEDTLSEAAELGNTAYAQAVARLVETLGIPDTVFSGGREAAVRRAVIEKSRSMRNRTQVITMIGRLQGLLDSSGGPTSKPAAPDANEAT